MISHHRLVTPKIEVEVSERKNKEKEKRLKNSYERNKEE
jgi:hypothetical protein